MHTPPDADWDKSLHDLRVKRIMKTDDFPQRHIKIGLAKAALLVTMDELPNDHAALLLASRREAINGSCSNRSAAGSSRRRRARYAGLLDWP